ncbi:MAG: hypothetical protein ACOVQ0_09265 [Novosphingobium sp.]|uniref:hypothetical protein n=1 Tax=Novosphingobium sp. TaxID=1874826 RepID=UPI003B991800
MPISRAPLTTTHPHGYVLVRADRKLGLLRISKNASTESKVRLDCRDWIAFDQFDGPSVAFLRDPYGRFLSSIPETMLRVTHFQIEDPSRKDRVTAPEDVYRELCAIAKLPIEQFAQAFFELVRYSFFDAHHEPQVSFLADRRGTLRLDPYLYRTSAFDQALDQIEARFGVKAVPVAQQSNKGGAKPLAGRSKPIDMARKLSGTGVYKRVEHGGPLMVRHGGGTDGPTTIREINVWCNQFTAELKRAALPASLRAGIEELYADDVALWQRIEAVGGDVPASTIWDAANAPAKGAAA